MLNEHLHPQCKILFNNKISKIDYFINIENNNEIIKLEKIINQTIPHAKKNIKILTKFLKNKKNQKYYNLLIDTYVSDTTFFNNHHININKI